MTIAQPTLNNRGQATPRGAATRLTGLLALALVFSSIASCGGSRPPFEAPPSEKYALPPLPPRPQPQTAEPLGTDVPAKPEARATSRASAPAANAEAEVEETVACDASGKTMPYGLGDNLAGISLRPLIDVADGSRIAWHGWGQNPCALVSRPDGHVDVIRWSVDLPQMDYRSFCIGAKQWGMSPGIAGITGVGYFMRAKNGGVGADTKETQVTFPLGDTEGRCYSPAPGHDNPSTALVPVDVFPQPKAIREYIVGLAAPSFCPYACANSLGCKAVIWHEETRTCALFEQWEPRGALPRGVRAWSSVPSAALGSQGTTDAVELDRAALRSEGYLPDFGPALPTYAPLIGGTEFKSAKLPAGAQLKEQAHRAKFGVDQSKQTATRDILRGRKDIYEAVEKAVPGFTLEHVMSRSGSHSYRLSDGRVILMMTGCTSHDCGGSLYVIAYDEGSGAVVAISERAYTPSGYELFGQWDEAMRSLVVAQAREEGMVVPVSAMNFGLPKTRPAKEQVSDFHALLEATPSATARQKTLAFLKSFPRPATLAALEAGTDREISDRLGNAIRRAGWDDDGATGLDMDVAVVERDLARTHTFLFVHVKARWESTEGGAPRRAFMDIVYLKTPTERDVGAGSGDYRWEPIWSTGPLDGKSFSSTIPISNAREWEYGLGLFAKTRVTYEMTHDGEVSLRRN